MKHYDIFISALDNLAKEASENFSKYDFSKNSIENIRSLSFIHLYLKVTFGILDFNERHDLITDGSYDGGIDAYYIDHTHKRIILIQSKFRANDKNFESKNIELCELMRIDHKRITDGEDCDIDGNEYNGKIKIFQKAISEINDIARWDFKVVILANCKFTDYELGRLVPGLPCEVFDYKRVYAELVYPLVNGTYFNTEDLDLTISYKKDNAVLEYDVEIDDVEVSTLLLYVPTLEIARFMAKYKNSVLKYNPRSYLDLARNTVNKEIEKTIKDTKTNEFSLFNNGITLLSTDTSFSGKTGKKGNSQLLVRNPQIINGGQTAYTLCRIFESGGEESVSHFKGKEVMLRVITFSDEPGYNENVIALVNKISKATNQQSSIDDADRRANDDSSIKFQDYLYLNHCYLYERKRGEFGEGLRNKYITRESIIKRDVLLRLCKACDFNPSGARSASKKTLFKEAVIGGYLNQVKRYDIYFKAYKVYEELVNIDKEMKKTKSSLEDAYGYAIPFGSYAVVSAVILQVPSTGPEVLLSTLVSKTLGRWKHFESWVRSLEHNEKYVSKDKRNFISPLNYYKSSNLDSDVTKYFSNDSVV